MTPVRIATVACLALIPIELGLVPPLRHFWAFNLWQYLPAPVMALLAAALASLCVPAVRDAVARAFARPPSTRAARAALLAAPLLLWLLRERRLAGDSPLLIVSAAVGPEFIFPDLGASFLFHVAYAGSRALGIGAITGTQILICAAAGGALACFAMFCRELAGGGRGALALALILGGGLLRVLAGHVEVYAFLLLFAGAYLWAALAYLRGRAPYLACALALGAAIWMHMSSLFLVPSLLLLPVLAGERARRALPGLAAAAAPSVLFLLLMFALGRDAALSHAWSKGLEWSGLVPSASGFESLLRPWWKPAGPGTRYVIYSPGHLKYLANAFFLLAPAAVPIVVAFAVLRPRRFVATPQALFLSTAAGSMLVYSSLVRPFWGPYDWDIFSLSAACLASLAACLLLGALRERPLAALAPLVLGATALCVTIPFLVAGIAPLRDAGPFATAPPPPSGTGAVEQFERDLGPWL